jgi:hypothetical protein
MAPPASVSCEQKLGPGGLQEERPRVPVQGAGRGRVRTNSYLAFPRGAFGARALVSRAGPDDPCRLGSPRRRLLPQPVAVVSVGRAIMVALVSIDEFALHTEGLERSRL